MSLKKSPLAPKTFPTMPGIRGVKLASAAAEIKYAGRDDVFDLNLEAVGIDDVGESAGERLPRRGLKLAVVLLELARQGVDSLGCGMGQLQ